MDFIVIMAIICAVIGGAIDGTRGAILGALLGIFGLLITAILRAGDKKS